jgi:hypothetical protein
LFWGHFESDKNVVTSLEKIQKYYVQLFLKGFLAICYQNMR